MSPALIGKLFGALLTTFILTRIVHHSLYKTQPPVSKALLVALTTLGVTVGIAASTRGIAEALTTYTPAILAWFVLDLVQARRGGASAQRSSVSEGNQRPEATQRGVSNHRDRLVVFGSLVVAIGIALLIRKRRDAADLVVWLFFAELLLVVGVAVNAHRRKHHLTWQQVLGQIVPVVLTMGVFLGVLMLIAAIQANWQTLGPILFVIGIYAGLIGMGLLVLYLAVRVVRAAWK